MLRSAQGRSRLLWGGGAAILTVLAFAYGLGVGARHWPPFALLKWIQGSIHQAPPSESRAAEAAAEIARIVREHSGPSRSEQARFAREFVYDHSIHKIDEEHTRYAWDTAQVLQRLHDHDLTNQDPPHLSCGPRALALQAVLDALEIENRVVHTFSGDYDGIRSHTFVEVFDDRSGRWVVHDPDYDLTYVEAESGQQVSLLQMVLSGVETVLPLSRRGRGWELNKVDCLRDHYFQVAKYDIRADDSTVLVVNVDRFPAGKRFPANDGVTFEEFSKSRYRHAVFLPVNTVPCPPKAPPKGDRHILRPSSCEESNAKRAEK